MNLHDQKLQAYLEAHSGTEPDYLAHLNRETHLKVQQPRMLSGHYQGRLLSMLSKLIRPKTVLDIGTYTGYSALCLAEGLAEGGIVHTIDRNPETVKMAKAHAADSPYAGKIQFHEGEALPFISGTDKKFDLVFIDAKKEEYLEYYKLVFDKLNPGGVILTDNVLWSGMVVDDAFSGKATEALREFNDFVQNDERVDKVMLPIRDGLYMIRKHD